MHGDDVLREMFGEADLDHVAQHPAPAEQVSEELQLLGKMFDDHLSYTLGTFMLWSQNQTGPHNVTYTSAFGGVSAQGGVYDETGKPPNDEAQRIREMDLPSERITVVSAEAQSHDLTEPLQWLLA